MKKGQPDLFNVGPQWKQKGRFTADDGSTSLFDFAYTSSTHMVNFSVPGDLKTNLAYVYELVNMPAQQAAAVDRNVSDKTDKVQGESDFLNTEITTKKAEGTIETLQEKSIFNGEFKSSAYATFAQKLDSYSYSVGWTWAVQTGVNELGTTLEGNEYFEKIEIHNTVPMKSLIQFEADLSDNFWYQSLVYPLVYEGYPINGTVKLEKETEALGVPPSKSIYIRQTPSDQVYRSNTTVTAPTLAAIVYNLPLAMYRHYLELQAKCANLSITTSNERMNTIISTPFPVLRQGDYKINIRYSLPGLNKVTSERKRVINYSVRYIK